MRLLLVEDTVELARWLQKALTQKDLLSIGWRTASRQTICCIARSTLW